MAKKLFVDNKLILEAQKQSGNRSKKEVVTEALQKYIQRRKQLEIVSLFNSIDYDSDYDYKNNASS